MRKFGGGLLFSATDLVRFMGCRHATKLDLAYAIQSGPVRGMAPGTLQRLTTQARLQNARKTGAPFFELRPAEPGKGIGLLPERQQGDIFYDIEGDPHHEGGLEYLHGL